MALTYSSSGNLYSSASLAASASVTTTNVADFTSGPGGILSVDNTGGGTVAATNGCRVEILPQGDAAPTFDTVPLVNVVITTVVSTLAKRSFWVPTGKYKVKLTNLDASNAITVAVTSSAIT